MEEDGEIVFRLEWNAFICSVFHSKESCCTKLLVLSSGCLQAQCSVVLGRLLVRTT
jgi:hypothetical protein